MRKFVLIFCCLFCYTVLFAQEQDSHLVWEKSYKRALKKAKKENKKVLIYFTGSDWCGPCITLDRDLFSDKKFIDLANNNFILYKADFPRNEDLVTKDVKESNKKLQKKYKQTSFPTLLFVNSKGKEIGRKRGYIITEYYYPFFDKILKK